MLTIRQGEGNKQGELKFECLEGDTVVGRLTAHTQPDGGLTVQPLETTQPEAARSLLAVLEREAVQQRVPTVYLEFQDEAEKARYLPAGYSQLPGGGNILVKKLPLL